MQVNSDAHWRDSARSTRFFFFDGKAVFPLLLVIVYPRLWTLIVAVVAIAFFSILIRYGFTPMVFLRWFRSFLAGSRKMSKPWWM